MSFGYSFSVTSKVVLRNGSIPGTMSLNAMYAHA